jgi:Fic family protein
MSERANLKGISGQQVDLLLALAARERQGRGAQTAYDFEGFPTTSPYSQRLTPISASAARSSLERLVKRGLVERVAERPHTYRPTEEGRRSVLGGAT